MRQSLRIGLKSLLLFFFLLIPSADLWGADPRRVLFISSYHPGFPTFFQQVEGIKSVFSERPILLDIEFMDSKRFAERINIDNFYKTLLYKLSRSAPYDAVITGDDNALLFVLEHQQDLFKDQPIVFMGVNDVELALEQNANPFVTGVVEAVSMKETLTLMTGLHPQAKRIIALVDGTPSGQGDLKTFYRLQKEFSSLALSDISLANLSFDEIAARLRTLGEESVVLLLSAYRDKNGKTLLFDEGLQLIKENLSRPLYHLWYHGMGEGLLGGKLISHQEQGKAAAEMVAAILGGKRVEDLPVREDSPNRYIFDSRQLQRFGIDLSDLPESSILLNEPLSLYQQHKWEVWTLIVYSLLLLGMWINILRRKRTERALQQSEERYRSLVETIPHGIEECDTSGIITFTNAGYDRLFGNEPGEMIGKGIWEGVTAESERERLPGYLAMLVKERPEPTPFVAKNRARDGRLFDVQVDWDYKRDACGQLTGFVSVITDVTERKRVEEARALNESRLEALLKLNQMVAASTQEITDFALEEAIRLTKSQVGYLAFSDETETVFTMYSWSRNAMRLCTIKDKPITYHLEKMGLWGEAVRQRKPIITNDYTAPNPFKRGYPEGHVPLTRHMNIPLMDEDRIVAVAGVGNKEEDYDESDLQQLSLLMQGMWRLLQRQRAEEALRERKERIKLLLNSTAEAIYGLDMEGNCTFCNPACLKILGYEKESDLLGKNMHNLIHHHLLDGAEYPMEECKIYKAFRKGEEVHVDSEVLWRADGSSFNAEYWSYPIREGDEVIGSVVTFLDITDRKEAEKALRKALAEAEEARDKIELILKSVADGLIFTDMDNRVVLMSTSAEVMLGKPLQEVFLKPIDAASGNKILKEQLVAIQAGVKEEASVELPLHGDREEIRTVQAKSAVVRSKEGMESGVITLLIDVTRERELDRMKSEFIATAAHELRTPLTSIKGYSELLSEQKDVDAVQQAEFLSIIHEKSKVLERIIEDLLDLRRVESGQVIPVVKERCDIASIIRRAVFDYQQACISRRFETVLPEEPIALLADEVKTVQVLENLLSNAVKFSPEGSPVRVACEASGEIVQISVRDEGVGMTAEQVERVFEKFYRVDSSNTAKEGLGLGMAIVKSIIEAHDGKIWVESEPGKGTTVAFSLPREFGGNDS